MGGSDAYYSGYNYYSNSGAYGTSDTYSGSGNFGPNSQNVFFVALLLLV